MSSRRITVSVLFGAFLLGTCAQAATVTGTCQFGGCSALLTVQSLQVACNGKVLYEGTYRFESDFQTTRITALVAGGPQVTVQGIPSSAAQSKATLGLPDQTVEGTCGLSVN